MYWHLIPRSAVEGSSGFLLLDSSPLLEEKCYVRVAALVANGGYPFWVHGARAWTGTHLDLEDLTEAELKPQLVASAVTDRFHKIYNNAGTAKRRASHTRPHELWIEKSTPRGPYPLRATAIL